jgi:hypothetical protein
VADTTSRLRDTITCATSRTDVAADTSDTTCCSVRDRASDSAAARWAASSARSYRRRAVASNTVARTSTGAPVSSRTSTALTRHGRNEPSARTTSSATSRTAPCIRSSGARWVS